MTAVSGNLRKMRSELADGKPQYFLPLDDAEIPMNALLGHRFSVSYEGVINCVHCGRKTNKSFNQGYCFPCFKGLAQCDSCIVSPEKCHYFEGTCREPEWADDHCMQDHIVYLANSSGLKVGITRHTQVPTRWIDQGAVQALPILRVANRLQSGLVETVFKNHVADKTSWQAMLKGPPAERDMHQEAERLFAECMPDIDQLQAEQGLQAIQALTDQATVEIEFPVLEYPVKVKSINLDKTPSFEGQLLGIKGQYLMFDVGVINMRKYGGYRLSVDHD